MLLLVLACASERAAAPPPSPPRTLTLPEPGCGTGPAFRWQTQVVGADGGNMSGGRIVWRSKESDPWQPLGTTTDGMVDVTVPGPGLVTVLPVPVDACASADSPPPPVEAIRWHCPVDVVVTGPEGPVANAAVSIAPIRRIGFRGTVVGWTDEAGRADGVPAPCTGTFSVGAEAPDGRGRWSEAVAAEQVELTLSPALHLHGRVRSGETPLAGAQVSLTLRGANAAPGAAYTSVEVHTDAEGRWTAALANDQTGRERAEVSVQVSDPGHLADRKTVYTHNGEDLGVYFDLAPSRTVHMRCEGHPDESCDTGHWVAFRCGAPGERAALAEVETSGPEDRAQFAIQCPDVPALDVSMADRHVRVEGGNVAWFTAEPE